MEAPEWHILSWDREQLRVTVASNTVSPEPLHHGIAMTEQDALRVVGNIWNPDRAYKVMRVPMGSKSKSEVYNGLGFVRKRPVSEDT